MAVYGSLGDCFHMKSGKKEKKGKGKKGKKEKKRKGKEKRWKEQAWRGLEQK